MRIPSTLLILTILLGALSGCTGATFKAAHDGQSFPAYTGVLRELTAFPPAGTFDRVGVVVVDGTDYTADDRLKHRLREEAARHGANAIIYQGPVKTVPYRDGGLQKQLAAFALRTH